MKSQYLRAASLVAIATLSALPVRSGSAQDLEAGVEAIRLKDFAAAHRLLSELASGGDPDAQYLLAGLERRGLGTERNRERAAENYAALAERGHELSRQILARPPLSQWPALSDPTDPESALFWCAQTGRAAPAEALLDAGVSPDTRSPTGRTPLMEAAEGGHVELIQLLLSAGADPNLVDDSGHSALLLAVRRDRRDAADALMEVADVDQQDTHGNSALIVAVRKNHHAIAGALLAAGANVNRTNVDGQTALGIAKIRDDHRAVALLERHGGIAEGFVSTGRATQGALQLVGATPGDRPVWFIAADRGNAAAASELLAGGAKVDRPDADGMTALMIAAERNHQTLAVLLLRNGASSKTARPQDGWTALHFAAAEGHVELLRTLLNETLPPFPASTNGVDTLMLGIEREDRELISLILDAGVSPTGADAQGQSALMRAARRPMSTVVVDLIERGAEVDARDRLGRSALWYAADAGRTDNVGLLVRAGADAASVDRDGNGPLHRAAHHGYVRVITPLLRAGNATELENKSGATPLMIAAMRGHLQIVRDLVTSGHDLDHQNRVGNTAILIAAQRGDAEIVAQLLELGADPGIVNRGRLNVADIADRFGHRSVASVLEAW